GLHRLLVPSPLPPHVHLGGLEVVRHLHPGDQDPGEPGVGELAQRGRDLLREPGRDARRALHAAHGSSSSRSACSIPPCTPLPPSPKGMISVARSVSTASGSVPAIDATSASTLSQTAASLDTHATPNVARCGKSSMPTSAIETRSLPCTRSFSDRTTLRLSLSDRAPTISRLNRITPTNIAIFLRDAAPHRVQNHPQFRRR